MGRVYRIIHWTSLPDERKLSEFFDDEDFREYVKDHKMHFTDSLANWVVGKMKPADGTSTPVGVSQVKDLMQTAGISLKGCWTWGDVAYLYNMAKMDFYPAVLKTQADVIAYVKAVMSDPDGYEEVAFGRWLADIMIKKDKIDWDVFL